MDGNNQIDLSQEVEMIASTPTSLTLDQVGALHIALQEVSDPEDTYGPDYSISNEVQSQLHLISAMRNSVISEAGRVLAGVTSRELRDVVGSSGTMLANLVKIHERVINFDRMRAVENSVAETIREYPEDFQDKFFALLKTKLEAID